MAGRKLRAFRSRLLYGALVVVTAIGRRIPLRAGRVLGRALGTLAWHAARRERRKALANLGIAFPEWDEARREATARATFRHLGICLFEIARMPTLGGDSWWRVTEYEGFDRVLELIDSGRTVFLLAAHCGNWEWLAFGIGVGLRGRPMAVLQRERDDPAMNRYITDLRAHAGVRTIDRGSAASARGIIAAVRAPGGLGFMIDQNIRTESVKVPFFGRPALTPVGPAKLAIRAEAIVVAALGERRPDGTHLLRFLDPIDCRRDDDPVALTAKVTAEIEAQIRRVPEQWVWMHDRWRERRS